jgi:hypothetical protein
MAGSLEELAREISVLTGRLALVRRECLSIAETCASEGVFTALFVCAMANDFAIALDEAALIAGLRAALLERGISLVDIAAERLGQGIEYPAVGIGEGGKSGDQVRETAAPITVAAEPLMAAKIAPKGRPVGRDSGTTAVREPGAGRGPVKPSGGAPEPPAGIAAQSEPSGGENLRGPAPGCAVGLWTEDPAASGEFICLQQNAPADVAARNPNYQAGSKHHAREKQFYTPKLYQAIYSEQHRWIMAAGGQLPTGWILPAGAVLGADGHVTE